MTIDKDMLFSLIDKDKSMSIMKKVYGNYAAANGLEYTNTAEFVEKLPEDNLFILLSTKEIYDAISQTTAWKRPVMNLLRSIIAEEIRVHITNTNAGTDRSIRKLWYRKFKPRLQDLFIRAYKNGNYSRDLNDDAEWYKMMPRKLSEAFQYFCTNQLSKETGWYGNKATVTRRRVCTYLDIGIKDISRKKVNKKRKIGLEHLIKHFKLFKDGAQFKSATESNHDVMVNSYAPYEEIVEAIEHDIEHADDWPVSQKLHVVALVEKDAEFEICEKIAEYLGISLISGHGQNSISALERLAKEDMKIPSDAKIIFVSMTDHDPAGLRIARAPTEHQFVKTDLNVVLWIHSRWERTLTSHFRTTQSYIPNFMKSKKGHTEFEQNWIDKMGYDRSIDAFGGGKFGFELESMDDSQIREAFWELCQSVGWTAENMLETFKDNNREDVDYCVERVAEDEVKANTEIDKNIAALRDLRETITDPIDRLIEKLQDIKEEMISDIKDAITPEAEDVVGEKDFDDRDIIHHVKSYVSDLLKGYSSWSKYYYADICKSSVLNVKLKGILEDKLSDLFTLNADNYDDYSIDKEQLIAEISSITNGYEFASEE
jgi:hypothetical protein